MDDAHRPERPESLVGVNPFVWSVAIDRLMWFPEAGYGYFECDTEGVYTSDYFDRYAEQAEAPVGKAIMNARVDLVDRFLCGSPGPILDVGIGCGAFLSAWWNANGEGFGDDVNPAGLAWLDGKGKRRRLASGHDVVTFWDVLEHIRRPDEALAHVKRLAFVSLPIFRDVEHLMGSKHLRKNEHYHYWTRAGFMAFVQSCGFKVLECNAMETLLGRDEIETFVLERVEWL